MAFTAQKMKFSIMDLSSKCGQICRKRRIWSHLLEKSLTGNFFFCAVFIMMSNISTEKKFCTCFNTTIYVTLKSIGYVDKNKSASLLKLDLSFTHSICYLPNFRYHQIRSWCLSSCSQGKQVAQISCTKSTFVSKWIAKTILDPFPELLRMANCWICRLY